MVAQRFRAFGSVSYFELKSLLNTRNNTFLGAVRIFVSLACKTQEKQDIFWDQGKGQECFLLIVVCGSLCFMEKHGFSNILCLQDPTQTNEEAMTQMIRVS